MPFPLTINLASLGSFGYRIGAVNNSRSGIAVSAAGDFNDDGIMDFVIGGSGAITGQVNGGTYGEAYLIFGKAGRASLTLSPSIAAADGFYMVSGSTASFTGSEVSAIGDINDDGFDDFMVGAEAYDTAGSNGTGNNAGAAYVLFGRETGIGPVTLNGSMAASVGIRPETASRARAISTMTASTTSPLPLPLPTLQTRPVRLRFFMERRAAGAISPWPVPRRTCVSSAAPERRSARASRTLT